MSPAKTRSPAVEGWFTTGPEPALLGSRCATCSTVYFPPVPAQQPAFCRNPACDGEEFEKEDHVIAPAGGRLGMTSSSNRIYAAV